MRLVLLILALVLLVAAPAAADVTNPPGEGTQGGETHPRAGGSGSTSFTARTRQGPVTVYISSPGPQGAPGVQGPPGRDAVLPPITRGHLPGAGHQPVYREIASWKPASKTFVEARDARLQEEIDQEAEARSRADANHYRQIGWLFGETRELAEGQQDLRDLLDWRTVALLVLIVVIGAGLAARQED